MPSIEVVSPPVIITGVVFAITVLCTISGVLLFRFNRIVGSLFFLGGSLIFSYFVYTLSLSIWQMNFRIHGGILLFCTLFHQLLAIIVTCQMYLSKK